jgi:tetratricopeptide (TPR) repeat protein
VSERGSWDRVKELFHAATEAAADRERVLAGAPPEIRAEVIALLRAHDALPEIPVREGPGSTIGRYRLLQQIGEGGFGVVYMAEQAEPVRRKVALKVLKAGMDTRQVVARFEAERQALALMDHPHIAKVLDAGTTASGLPYFVMELVKGIPITQYADEAQLDLATRLDLFAKVCHAVQHAHQKGIVHRDLKPSNVLVTLHDGIPTPKVIDFGIAKALDRRLTDKTLFTEFRQMVGTPEYMAPEQAELSGLDVDTRADVYSLGVLLYELLTGEKPFDWKSLLARGYGEVLRTIREVEPPRPSTRISTMGDALVAVAKKRHTPHGALGRLLRGDLDWIVMKALEKDRSRRYETASALAEDVRRHLDHRPVLASPPSARYRMAKYVRRHRAGVAAAALLAVALLGSAGFAYAGMRRARTDAREAGDAEALAETRSRAARDARAREAEQRERADVGAREAEHEARRAETVLGLLGRVLVSADPHVTRGPNYTVRELLDDFERENLASRAPEPEIEAMVQRTMGKAFLGLGLVDRAEPHVERALALSPPGTVEHAYARELRARLLHDRARFSEAEREVREVLVVLEPVREANREAYAEARVMLADLLRHQARGEEAERTVRESLAWLSRIGAADSREAIDQRDMHARILSERLDLDGAEAIYRDLLARVRSGRAPKGVFPAEFLMGIAQCKAGRGEYDEPVTLLEEALAGTRERFGDAHPRTGTALMALGLRLFIRGDPDAGEAQLRKALSLLERAYGPEHPTTATTIAYLGWIAADRGDTDRALDLHARALGSLETWFGKDHFSTCHVRGLVAQARMARGEYDAAEGLAGENLRIVRATFAEDHPSVGWARYGLGLALYEHGRFAEAEPHLRAARDAHAKRFGDLHPDVMPMTQSVATLESLTGRRVEALRSYEALVERVRRTPGYRRSSFGLLLHALAAMRADEQENAEVEPLFQEAIAHLRAGYGDEHPKVGMALNTLGLHLQRRGEPARAESVLREAARILRKNTGAARTLLPAALANLGTALSDLRRLEQAEEALREALRIRQAVSGDDAAEWATTAVSLAGVLTDRGQPVEARALAERALAVRERLHGATSAPTLRVRNTLAVIAEAEGRLDEAETLYRSVLADSLRQHGEDREGAATVRQNLGLLLERRGRLPEALEQFHLALESRRRTHGDRHPAVASAVHSLGRAAMAAGDLEAAQRHIAEAVSIYEMHHGSEHRPLQHGWADLAVVAQMRNDLDVAEAVYRKLLPVRSDDVLLARFGMLLLQRAKHAEAERVLRECLALRVASAPDSWLRWNAASLVGASLAGQRRYEEAEPLLVEGWERMAPPEDHLHRKHEALARVVALYEAWARPEKAREWREKGEAK